MIVIDTDVLIEWLDRDSTRQGKIEECVASSNELIATTAINIEEILYGYLKRKKQAELPKDHPLWDLKILPFTFEDAMLAAKLE